MNKTFFICLVIVALMLFVIPDRNESEVKPNANSGGRAGVNAAIGDALNKAFKNPNTTPRSGANSGGRAGITAAIGDALNKAKG